jgi:uroporphyrin-III C-methyltransferase
MTKLGKQAVVVVGHGSRRDEANRDVIDVARRVGISGGFPLVEAAFLEIARPTIDEAFTSCVAAGATHIVVHPYFLSPGRHSRGDLPVEVRTAASRHPGLTYQITDPLAGHPLVIEASIERIREVASPNPKWRATNGSQSGIVYFVGAGPGDPGLLTIKALDLLRRANVVVYDYLVNPDLLAHSPRHAERIYAGKIGGGRQTPQEEINRLLIDRAQAGKVVVRLKGGDPFLFGRGAEEAQAVRSAGISFEIVPGVSAALAVPAYAGIPLTHRGLSSSVTVVTGVQAGEPGAVCDLFRAGAADTLVVLMGLAQLRQIATELISSGRSSETPAAVIRWGTYEAQQVVTGTLATIANAVEQARLRAPSLIVIGEVVRLRDELKWFASSAVIDDSEDRTLEEEKMTTGCR